MMRSRIHAAGSAMRLLLTGALALVTLGAASARAEYRINAGDVLELSVPGSPELRQRSAVNVDGEISFPLLGRLKVLGRPLSEVRAQIEEIIPTKVHRIRSSDGRENVYVIGRDEVQVNIAEYRPIYLDGDVSKPGEQPFRPSMTVRQAVAVAGGYDIMRFRSNNPYMETADLRSQYEELWANFAQEQARLTRLEAELNGKAEVDFGKNAESPTAPGIVAQIHQLEADLMKTRNADVSKEKTYLNTAIRQASARLNFLNEQQKKEEEGMRLDVADLERVTMLQERGQGTIMRVTDARRSLLLSSTRQLQTIAQATQVELQRDELSRRLQKVDDARRIEILREIETSTVRLSSIRSRLQAVNEKMVYIGTVRSELVRGRGGSPEVMIFRKRPEGEERIVGREDTELLPGDVVQITLALTPPEGARP